mgnify:CR=1 FL=1
MMINLTPQKQKFVDSASELLEISLNYAIANARLKYWRSPFPLPKLDDYDTLSHCWLKVYNAGGKGFMKKWNEARVILGGNK